MARVLGFETKAERIVRLAKESERYDQMVGLPPEAESVMTEEEALEIATIMRQEFTDEQVEQIKQALARDPDPEPERGK